MIYDWRKLKLKSCDQILCSGTGSLSKKIIWFNKLTGIKGMAAEISHVAMIYSYLADWVFESTTLNKFANKKGVQMNKMGDWIKNYKGRVWVRKLDFERTPDFGCLYDKFIADFLGKPYESGIPGYLSLFLCGLRWNRFIPFYKPPNTAELHCSETNVLGTQYLHLCDDKAVPNRMPPSQFWEGREFEKHLLVPIHEPLRIK